MSAQPKHSPLEAMLRDIVLKPMELNDLVQVMRIENVAYTHPWTEGNFSDSLNAGYSLMCAWHSLPGIIQRRELIGYFVTMPVMDEVHLLNITISPAHQGVGLGRWLLGVVHEQAQRAQASAIWLEVRPSNAAGIALYSSYGFTLVARRRGYYPALNQQREDALVLKLLLGDTRAKV